MSNEFNQRADGADFFTGQPSGNNPEPAERYETAAAGNLPNASQFHAGRDATRVESGAGPDIQQSDLLDHMYSMAGAPDVSAFRPVECGNTTVPPSAQSEYWN